MASSSSSLPKRWKYDIFLSFRGEDTRYNFVDHLYAALKRKGIHRVFRDEEELERGREISPELVKAIEESRFFIIVFSENFAFSRWCLDELAMIIDCTKPTGQIAFPIFYNVDPSDVRKQTGSFADAFAIHGNDNSEENMEKMQRWRIALSEAANLAGWDSRNRHEAEFIQEIVDEMFHKLNPALLHLDKNLVGINFNLKEVDILLCTGSKDVKFVGIYGLGGIGKTTIATAIYNMISYQFEGCSYLENVREISEKNGLGSLQAELLENILGEKVRDGRSVIKNRLSHKKVLLILDDVDHRHQLEKLAGNHDWFGPGSRIIITTRDERLLVAHGVLERYKVKVLAPDASLELFSWKAFKLKYPTDDFVELSRKVVNYAKGLPIALDVLGSTLCGKSKPVWISVLDKLKKFPNEEVTNILKISYDGLEQTEKDIFLDIACFFKWNDKEYVTKLLDSCGFFADGGIQVLIDRSLISLSENNMLLMHDLVQEMGRDIVFKESPKDPSKRSRLWLYEDIRYVLMNNSDTQAVEAIMLQDWPGPPREAPLSLLEDYHSPLILWEDFAQCFGVVKAVDLHVSANAFLKMNNLRFFKISGVRVHLPQGLIYLPDELRIVDWKDCPLEYFPSSFQPEKLVELSMHRSCIKQLWKEVKALGNLISIDLSYSGELIELPDLTGARNLEKLILDDCTKMFELHPSVGLLRRLKYLSLRHCYNLRSLPSNLEMESLETLNLEGTDISEVPSSIGNITGLKVLDLNFCKNLKCLPSSICTLEYLEELLLNCCRKLENLPENLGNLKSLVKLDLSYTTITESPPSIVRLKNLQSLSFEGCKGTFTSKLGKLKRDWFNPTLLRSEVTDLSDFKLHDFSGLLCSLTYLNLSCCSLSDGVIPGDIGSLSSLKTLNLSENNFVSLPFSISQLSRLTTLRLNGCNGIRELPELPSSVATMNANDCTSLERLSDLSTVFKPAYVCFGFANCFKLASTSFFSDALRQFQHQALFGNLEIFSMCLPWSDIPGWFSHQNNEGSSVSIQLPSNWYNTQLRGLAFCIIVAYDARPIDERLAVILGIGLGTDGADVGIFPSPTASSSAMEISYKDCEGIKNDHVILCYISRAWLKEHEEKSQLEFRFTRFPSNYLLTYLPTMQPQVKTCGIRLIYDEDNEEVNIQSKRRRSC